MLLPASIVDSVTRQQPCLWLNDQWRSTGDARKTLSLSIDDLLHAGRHLNRFARLLSALFPELAPTQHTIESPLIAVDRLRQTMVQADAPAGRWYVKADHTLPIAGSIKARGGIYEVLLHAEDLMLRAGPMKPDDDRVALASATARALFGRHTVAVGSTGNLGLSIGVMAAALGFRATVHMSSDAKAWKKERLRACGVEVIEHAGDFGEAVAAGRAQAATDPTTYFVDDEHSVRLFLGYSIAALRLKEQLALERVAVDARHPLFVYIPCGVGGAPGGITFGLRQIFGDDAHCFFAEPVATPCMLVQLASGSDRPVSVRDVGLDGRTEADGLAVARASPLAASLVRPLVSGIFTAADSDLFEDLYVLEQTEAMRVEPSAAAALRGPRWLLSAGAGERYLEKHDLSARMHRATHILWTTGGAFLPDAEYRQFHERGRTMYRASEQRR